MDLAQHFESYRKSLLAGTLDEAAWYSKQLKSNTGGTVYDWLIMTLNAIKSRIDCKDEPAYRGLLARHRHGMITVFSAMVEDVMWDYRSVTPNQVLDLIDEHGTNWFKFCRIPLETPVTMPDGRVVPMRWVGRYSDHPACGANVIFDADELDIFRQKPGVAKAAFKMKLEIGRPAKIIDVVNDTFMVKDPAQVNTEAHVHDWAAPLFWENRRAVS